jgi:DNA-binding LacI/PurR family transcriptional regulator
MLLQMINREAIDSTLQVLRPELVIRESTAQANRE